MALKAIYDRKEDVPAGLEDHYKEVGGKWSLQVDGMKPDADLTKLQTALTAERTAHGTTKATLTALSEALGDDVEPDKVKEKLDKLATLEASGKKPGTAEFEAEVEKRVKQKTGPLQRERDTLKTENDTLKGKDRSRTIRDKLIEAAKKENIRDSAIDDVLARENMFELDASNNVVTRDGVGTTPGLAPDVWLKDIGSSKPHWFEESQGGGSRGGTPAMNGVNPWAAASFNLTQQADYVKKHGPEKAAQLKKQAGYKDDGKRPVAASQQRSN